ncbi:hypothetical protein D3C74_49640 [compost metagenome]
MFERLKAVMEAQGFKNVEEAEYRDAGNLEVFAYFKATFFGRESVVVVKKDTGDIYLDGCYKPMGNINADNVNSGILLSDLSSGMDVEFKDENGNLTQGWIFEVNPNKPEQIIVAVEYDMGEVSTVVPLRDIVSYEWPEGPEFEYLKGK